MILVRFYVPALLAATMSVACGGGDGGDSGPGTDAPGSVPDVDAPDEHALPPVSSQAAPYQLPAGGRCSSGVHLVTGGYDQFAVTTTGALWFRDGDGVIAVNGDTIRRYDASNAPLPQLVSRVFVDALDRVWIEGETRASGPADQAIVVLDDGEWRELLQGEPGTLLGVSGTGTAWVVRTHGDPLSGEAPLYVQTIFPALGDELELPTDDGIAGGNLSLDREGAIWWFVYPDTGYRWADGAWSGPFAWTLGGFSSSNGVNWSRADDGIHIIEWTGSAISDRLIPADLEGAGFVGFASDFDALYGTASSLRWMRDGQPRPSMSLPAIANVLVGPNGEAYVTTSDGVYREVDGQLVLVLPLLAAPAGDCP